MFRSIVASVILSAVFLISSLAFAAQDHIKSEHVEINWLAPEYVGRLEEKMAIRFRVEPGWHIYWRNPGDSGAAPKFQFASEKGDAFGPIHWPTPQRIKVDPLTNIGYEGEVVFPFSFQAASGVTETTATVDLEWLVCKLECIPGFGKLTLKRPVRAASLWRDEDKALLERFVAQTPEASSRFAGWSELRVEPEHVELRLLANEFHKRSGDVFPLDAAALSPAEPEMERVGDHWTIRIRRTPAASAPDSWNFVIAQEGRSQYLGPLAAQAPQVKWQEYLIYLALAFLGGLFLNVMPCVLPVLSIKVFSMTKESPEVRVKGALLYCLGVVLTMMAFGGLVLLLRWAGQFVGWGFHLQSPYVILGLIILFWLLAFNFLGVFEYGSRLMQWAGRSKSPSSFMTGVLSVIVATPCAGPFMGSALGASLTLPAVESMGIFFGLGLGLAFPFLLFAIVPASFRLVPRPGRWMDHLKKLLAVPLLATVVWLVWVLSLQVSVEALWVVLAFLILSGATLVVGQLRALRLVLLLLTMVSLVWAAVKVQEPAAPRVAEQDELWKDFSDEAVAAALKEGRPVFIDFTAAWCITCQLNKKAVLRTEAATEIFKSHNVALFTADWTNYDERITQTLARFGRNSIPFYVFYPAGTKEMHLSPGTLPQVLRLSDIEGLFPKANKGESNEK